MSEVERAPEGRPRGSDYGPVWGFGLGALIVLLGTPLNMVAFALLFPGEEDAVSGNLAPLIPLMFFGVGQLIYAIPAGIVLAVRRRTDVLKGLVIVSGAAFVINAACVGFVSGW